ncbi:hypothetical protein B296_00041685 [Ensete ventricosum]|uniref:Uncharacterized protein n=1 Tax=Ensete ventricosum TaxID=4639 RepID=A0A426Z001_ENSVE|nr:hypothetical protein B296_00041685 [Ensete ventricosum]
MGGAGVHQEPVKRAEAGGQGSTAEGPRVVASYKVSRGFESGLKKMGRVSYEFEYRVALERLRGKHPEIAIKQDLFAKCPEDTDVEMDLNQPFDDSTSSEK